MLEDEMVGWYHRLDGHEFEQAPGVGDGPGSLACCSPWGHKKSDTTEQLNWTEFEHPQSLVSMGCCNQFPADTKRQVYFENRHSNYMYLCGLNFFCVDINHIFHHT